MGDFGLQKVKEPILSQAVSMWSRLKGIEPFDPLLTMGDAAARQILFLFRSAEALSYDGIRNGAVDGD